MGMATGGSAAGGRRRRRGARRAPVSDINMTPFIDVMLVLLIIFMVAAPLMTVGVPIDLPRTGAGQLNVERVPLTVSIGPDGAVFVGEDPIEAAALVETLTARAQDGPEERIYVRADRTAPYGEVARVMALITGGGFSRVALVTEQEQN
jgi:biopolymer transport protein TolR